MLVIDVAITVLCSSFFNFLFYTNKSSHIDIFMCVYTNIHFEWVSVNEPKTVQHSTWFHFIKSMCVLIHHVCVCVCAVRLGIFANRIWFVFVSFLYQSIEVQQTPNFSHVNVSAQSDKSNKIFEPQKTPQNWHHIQCNDRVHTQRRKKQLRIVSVYFRRKRPQAHYSLIDLHTHTHTQSTSLKLQVSSSILFIYLFFVFRIPIWIKWKVLWSIKEFSNCVRNVISVNVISVEFICFFCPSTLTLCSTTFL